MRERKFGVGFWLSFVDSLRFLVQEGNFTNLITIYFHILKNKFLPQDFLFHPNQFDDIMTEEVYLSIKLLLLFCAITNKIYGR